MSAGQLPWVLIGVITLSALLLGFWQRKVSRKLGHELGEFRQRLLELETKWEQKPSFSNSLDLVERERRKVEVHCSGSEKYRYVASMFEQGVNAQGIAAALQMAPVEVEQLLQLTQLKQKSFGSGQS